MLLGNFDIQLKCGSPGCDDDAEKVIILSDESKVEMTVCFFCAPHAMHHESMFKERSEKN